MFLIGWLLLPRFNFRRTLCLMLCTNAPWDTIPSRRFKLFYGWDASRHAASIGQREVQIQADGGRAAWRAETMQIVCDFSAADGFRRDAHLDIRREAQRQTRPRRRSKLHVAAHARTDACRLDGRPCAELAGRGSGDTAASAGSLCFSEKNVPKGHPPRSKKTYVSTSVILGLHFCFAMHLEWR